MSTRAPSAFTDLAEIESLLHPSRAGGLADRLRIAAVLARRTALRASLETVPEDRAWAAPLARAVSELLDGLTAGEYLAAFDHPMLFAQLAAAARGADLPPGLEASGSAPVSPHHPLRILRFFIGGPALEAGSFVLPEEVIGEGLYLPHLHGMLLSRGGPVAVAVEPDRLIFTWVSGDALTLPREGFATPIDLRTPGLVLGHRAEGWPVLNGIPELHDHPPHFPRGADPTWADLDLLAQGRALLARLWPEAHADVARVFSAVFVFPLGEANVFSLSSGHLRGSFNASLRHPVQVADNLIHEGSHTRLQPLFEVDPLLENGDVAEHPSPWRKDLRPLRGLLNGIHAFLAVVELYRRVAPALPESRETARSVQLEQREKLSRAMDTLLTHGRPTEAGRRFLAAMAQAVSALETPR